MSLGTYTSTWADVYIGSRVFLDGQAVYNDLTLGAFADFGLIFTDTEDKTLTGLNHLIAADVRGYLDDDTALVLKFTLYNTNQDYDVILKHNDPVSMETGRIWNTQGKVDLILTPDAHVDLSYYEHPTHGFKYFI